MVPLLGKLKQTRLWSLLLSHRRRVAVSVGVSLFGSALLIIAVQRLNMNASLANGILSPIMFFVGFFVVREFAFSDCEASSVPALSKWLVKYSIMTPASQSIFIWLVEVHHENFMLAYVIKGGVICLPGYLITLWVFLLKGSGVKWVAERVRVRILAIYVWAMGVERA